MTTEHQASAGDPAGSTSSSFPSKKNAGAAVEFKFNDTQYTRVCDIIDAYRVLYCNYDTHPHSESVRYALSKVVTIIENIINGE